MVELADDDVWGILGECNNFAKTLDDKPNEI